MEGRSKLRFSHIRNKANKTTPRPSFCNSFWAKTRHRIKKILFRRRLKNSNDFSCDFLLSFIGFGTLWAPPKNHISLDFDFLLSLLRHIGAKRVPKLLQDGPRGRFSPILDHRGNENFKNFFIISSIFSVEGPAAEAQPINIFMYSCLYIYIYIYIYSSFASLL